MLGDLGIVSGGHDERDSGGYCPISLIGGQNRTGAQQHIRDFPGNGADSIFSSGGSEGDFCGRESAGHQCLGQGDGFAGILNSDNRDNADLADPFQNFIHNELSFRAIHTQSYKYDTFFVKKSIWRIR